MGTYLVVDGNSLTYRAFFALPTDMATASGQVTNAVFGFTSMLINVMKDHKPDGVLVAFDRPEPTFRHEAEPLYKAQREAAPGHPAPADGSRARGARRDRDHRHRPGRLGGRRPDRHRHRPPRRGRPRRDHRDRRPRQLPARSRPRRDGALQQARRQRLRVLRRGGDRGEDRCDARRCTRSTPRCAATAATTCPVCPASARRRRRS